MQERHPFQKSKYQRKETVSTSHLAGTELAQLSNLLAIEEEQDGYGKESRSQASKQSHGPIHSQIVEHARGEHGETCT